MRSIIRSLCILGLVSLSSLWAQPTLDEFFAPAAKAAKSLSPDRPFPLGQQLLFTLYSIRSTKNDWAQEGFSAIGPYYGAQSGSQYAPYPDIVSAARALGKSCLYRIGLPLDFKKGNYKMPSDQEIRDGIKAQMLPVVGSKEIAVWYLTPEEISFRNANQMRYLKVASEAIKANDPDGRPIMEYQPNNRSASELSLLQPYLDFASKGMYVDWAGLKDYRAWIRWSVEQEVAAIASTKPAATPVAVLWMANLVDSKKPASLEVSIRHDIYLSLVSGAKGIVVYSGYRRKGFTAFDDYLAAYAKAASELNGTLGLGRLFLFGERKKDLVVRESGTTTMANLPLKFGKSYPAISTFDVAMGNRRYLFIVNTSEKSVKVDVSGLPTEALSRRDLLGAGDALSTKSSFDSELSPYAVQCWEFSRVQ